MKIKINAMGKMFFILLICSFYSQAAEGQAQQPPKIIPPSPNAAAFAKYGNVPVSTYTGIPNISVPIYEIKVRDISVPISLSYHASGIKVSEEASRVGLGWVLNSGGVISRNIVNKDDFIVDITGYLNTLNNSPVLPSGPQFAPVNNSLQAGTTLSFIDTQNAPGTVAVNLDNYIYGNDFDYEPDQFSYSFMGYSGQFILGRDRQPLLQKQEKIKITPNADGSTWEVMTADGLKYTFAASEYFVDLNTAGAEQKSAWYLTEINSPQGEKVTFHYDVVPAQFIKPVGHYQETIQASLSSCQAFNCTPRPGQQGALPRKKYSNIYLSYIEWQHGKVEFVMDDRDDLEGDKRVQSIKVYLNKKILPQEDYVLQDIYNFGYSYFDYSVGSTFFPMPDVTAERLRKRLKLECLSKYSAVANSPKEFEYVFKYYETSNSDQLPAKNSYARDHWGFYNGKTGNTSLIPSYKNVLIPGSLSDVSGMMGPERNPSADYMRAFSLKEIVYPTKGKTTFYYGANDYEIVQDNSAPTEIYQDWSYMLYDAVANKGVLKSTLLDFRDEYVTTTGSVIPIEVSAAFRTNSPCGQVTGVPNIYFEIVSEDGLTTYSRVSLGLDRTSDPTAIDKIYCDPNQVSMGVFTYKGFVTLQPGKYLWRAFVDGQETRFQDISAIYTRWVDSRKRSPLGSNVKYALGGGLRLEQVEDYDPVSNKTFNIRKFEYHYTADTDADGIQEVHSYGKRMVKPDYSYFDVGWEKKLLDPINLIYSTCTGCVYLMRQSDSFLPATGSQGNMVGYDKVIESSGLNRENGYTEYQYENQPDLVLPAYYPHGTTHYPLKPPIISTKPNPLNGMLKQKTEYTTSGLPVHQVINSYATKYSKAGYGLEYKRITAIGFDPGDYASVYALLGNRADVLMSVYTAMNSAFYPLASSTESFYKTDGTLQVATTTTNSYDNPDHLQLTETIRDRSDARKMITTFKYAADYTDAQGGAAITLMKGSKYMHTSPVETTRMDETQGTRKILNKDITIYDIVGGRVFPKEKIALTTTAPLLLNQLTAYTPAQGYDASRYRKVFSLDYTSEGNLNKIQKTSDAPVSFLWDIKKTMPVAEVSNAESTECFYESFEGTTGASVVEDALAAHAGRYYYNGHYTVSFTLPNARAYTIEYWFYENNKWNYASKDYSGNTVLNEGTAIDDVRIYPKDARMKSYTYEPLTGMTSMTDASGAVLFYEYDSFGRLKLIRDTDRNIVKTYEYNYQIQN